MTLGRARQPHLTRVGRLLALLLVMLLSVSSLGSHAAMDSCAANCDATQVEISDHANPDCSACAAISASPLVSYAPPEYPGRGLQPGRSRIHRFTAAPTSTSLTFSFYHGDAGRPAVTGKS